MNKSSSNFRSVKNNAHAQSFFLITFRWHGHPCQLAMRARDPSTSHTMRALLAIQESREKQILEIVGPNLRETIWECEFDRLLQLDPGLAEFAKGFHMPPPIQIRQALYGGRTETIRTLKECGPGETLRYLDFCVSIYNE